MRDAKRLEEILRIRIDGAQEWDVRDYVREREAGDEAAAPWKLTDGEDPLTDAQIVELTRLADRAIVASVQEDLESLLARQIVQRRTLYARAVNNGELTVALACLRDEVNLLGLTGAKVEHGEEEKLRRITRVAQALEGPGAGQGAGESKPKPARRRRSKSRPAK